MPLGAGAVLALSPPELMNRGKLLMRRGKGRVKGIFFFFTLPCFIAILNLTVHGSSANRVSCFFPT
jgi:hypothetical protein